MSGLETTFTIVKDNLKSKDDVIMVVLHWLLVREGFKCVGVGEQFPENVGEGSELLPTGWNNQQDVYILRYVKEEKRLLIKAVKAADYLIVTALLTPDVNREVSAHFMTRSYITDNYKDFRSAFTEGGLSKLQKEISNEITNKLVSKTSSPKSASPTRGRRDPDPDPLRIGPPRYPSSEGRYEWEDQGRFPPRIGGADLDPFGREQGSMLMDPRSLLNRRGMVRPGVPPGHPSGARFDPFGPDGAGPQFPNPRHPTNRPPRYGGPDPDHMAPPGYDDMFM